MRKKAQAKTLTPQGSEADSVKCQLAAETLRTSGFLRLRATGSSMLPAIWPGDILDIRRCRIGVVRTGEIALFECYGRLVAHRVIGRQGSALITQGDTLPAPDPQVTEAELLGTVFMIRRGRRQFRPPAHRGIA